MSGGLATPAPASSADEGAAFTDRGWAEGPSRAHCVPDASDNHGQRRSSAGRVDEYPQVDALRGQARCRLAHLAVWGSGVRVPSAPPGQTQIGSRLWAAFVPVAFPMLSCHEVLVRPRMAIVRV